MVLELPGVCRHVAWALALDVPCGLASAGSYPVGRQVYYIPAGDAELKTKGFVPLQASDANSVVQDHYDDYDACNVRAYHESAMPLNCTKVTSQGCFLSACVSHVRMDPVKIITEGSLPCTLSLGLVA